MNTSHRSWLLEQIPQWEREGLLTAEAAQTLRERHAVDSSQPGVAQMVMGSLGALLIGTGLIAVLGYNWDDFSRPVRLLFAFLPLLATQIFSFCVLRGGAAFAAWVRETAALLQTLATGACIALVSQIYHLGGEWTEILFTWFLLSLPLVWVLRSHTVAIFYLIAIAVWSAFRVVPGAPWQEGPLLYPILLLGLLPYWPGWKDKAPLSVTVRWIMAISACVGLASAAVSVTATSGDYFRYQFEVSLWLWTLTAAAIALFPLHQAGIAESTGRKPQVVLGTLWLLGYGVAATFHDVSGGVVKGMTRALSLPWCWGLLLVLAVFVLMAIRRRRWAVLAIASIALLPIVCFPFVGLLDWAFTLYLALVGITLIVLDFAGKIGAPRLGALLLSVLIIARMADSHFSLLAKGIAFIAVGIAFLAFNYLTSRRRRQPALPAA